MISEEEDAPLLIEAAGPDVCETCGEFCEEENLHDGDCSLDLWED